MSNTNKTGNNPYRLDARESAFFARECEYIKAKTYDAKPPDLKALSLIPVNSDAGNGVSEVTFRRYTGVGLAKIIADYAKDFPRVDIYGEEDSVKVHGIGVAYGYNIKEIRMSQRTGKNLDARKALVARRAHEEKWNSMALKSSPEIGTRGLLDYPGITETTLPADGANGSKTWASKTVDQILRDIDLLYDAVNLPTFGRETPDTLLVPKKDYNILTSRRLGDNTTTLMKFLLENKPELKRIEWLNELAGAGVGGTDRVMVGCFDEDHLDLELTQAFEQFDAEQEGMEFTIPCHSECAGTIVYYPMAFAFADGI